MGRRLSAPPSSLGPDFNRAECDKRVNRVIDHIREEKCRYDACVVVPEDFAADRWVNVMDIPGGRYGGWTFTGTAHEIQAVWDRIFTAWLPTSGYQPDDRACVEVYRGSPGGKPGSFRCELCLPVRPR